MSNEPINVFEYEPLAREHYAADKWDYIIGGAEDEITLRENRAAFQRTFLRPRYLMDIAACDLTTTVLGFKIPFPLMLAPTGYQRLSHPDGECETARGASVSGIPMMLSTLATCSMEDVARAATCPLLYQWYMLEDMGINEWLVRRAERNGYRAIVFTVDLPVDANRERDRRNQLSFQDLHTENVLLRTDDTPDIVRRVSHYQELKWKVDMSWRDVEWLRKTTNLPIVVKGLLTKEDALLAKEHGAAGIVVSNHGGRQLDGAPATLDVLPEMAEAVGDALELYLDGGVRRGADILKAVALGARAVCIGRPYIWGLAVDGANGVARVIELLRKEFETAMILTGKKSVGEVDGGVIWRKA